MSRKNNGRDNQDNSKLNEIWETPDPRSSDNVKENIK